jgi:hypothetical protein
MKIRVGYNIHYEATDKYISASYYIDVASKLAKNCLEGSS